MKKLVELSGRPFGVLACKSLMSLKTCLFNAAALSTCEVRIGTGNINLTSLFTNVSSANSVVMASAVSFKFYVLI